MVGYGLAGEGEEEQRTPARRIGTTSPTTQTLRRSFGRNEIEGNFPWTSPGIRQDGELAKMIRLAALDTVEDGDWRRTREEQKVSYFETTSPLVLCGLHVPRPT